MESVSTDAEILHHVFKENNDLRAKFSAQQRELYNKSIQLENAEEEIKALRLKIDSGEVKANTTLAVGDTTQARKSVNADSRVSPTSNSNNDKQLEEARFTIERQHADILQLREECRNLKENLSDFTAKHDTLLQQNESMNLEVQELRQYKANALQWEEELKAKLASQAPAEDTQVLQQHVKDLELSRQMLKKQMMDIAVETNLIHNAQQNQLQGVEGMIEVIRREYDEFIHITKLENESFRAMQQAEYDNLKNDFETHKNQSFEEKKKLMMEYQTILTGIQAQFDEYRSTAEMLLNVEMMKLEDEISSQAIRYEQEIMYVIQAKDKFYSDMMVAKDAKIMSLIEGSDLQSIMQKHEMDMENARKEHSKEIERIKSDHDSESKNVILLLQRQNVSLESKTEKLQSHLKMMETRLKELLGTIETKNNTITERDAAKKKLEEEYQNKLAEAYAKVSKLSQEKEHLRHKVIRLNLNAKGEGENSIENMIKRLNRDTSSLGIELDDISTKYENALTETQSLSKKLREKEKMIDFLEKEISRRTTEFNDMTRTFEEFLARRAKQSRKQQFRNSLDSATLDDSSISSINVASRSSLGGLSLIKTRIPAREMAVPSSKVALNAGNSKETTLEIERGYVYLKRFKNLSKAFATGEFRALSNVETTDQSQPGPWQKTPLYARLDETHLAIAKLYNEQATSGQKASLYQPTKNRLAPVPLLYQDGQTGVKLESETKKVSQRPPKDSDTRNLMIGGKPPLY